MATSNRAKELMGLTASVAPTRTEREKTPPRSAPGQMLDSLTGRDEALNRAEQAEAALAELKSKMRAKLSDLHEVPGRRRYKTPEEYAELKANIRKHRLLTPIDVEVRPEGGYNIVAGHHRTDILRELLAEGEPDFQDDAPIHIIESENTDQKAFYSNLFHPAMPDYEKWRGLQKIVDTDPEAGATYHSLSAHTGLSVATIGRLARFKELPNEAHEMLVKRPDAIGATTAQKLAQIAIKGGSEAVVEAIRDVIEKGITQEAAVTQAANRKKDPPATQKDKPKESEPIKIKSGREVYCTMTPVGGALRLEFKTEGERLVAQQIIQEALDKLAQLERPGKNTSGTP